MAQQQSGKFFVGSIITFIITFFVINLILMLMQGIAKNIVAPESMTDEAIQARIQPVAEVYIGEAPVIEVAVETEVTSGNGQQVITQVCALCHSTGMMSSPKLGSASDWAPRIEQGIDVLYDHAINGFNMMPARGGRPDLSDDAVKEAVDAMLEGLQ